MSRCTVSGQAPVNAEDAPVPNSATKPDGQHVDHWVLCKDERAKGFIRPLRLKYQHVGRPAVYRQRAKEIGIALGLSLAFSLAGCIIKADAKPHRHHRSHHHVHHNPTSGHSLVALINSKLRRWVHPTGKCNGRELLATFYWQGSRTATGERFNPDGHTVAVKARSGIPFGSHLTVTNPHNGRSVVVRVNDRGPATIADIDLSRGAARALGMSQSSYVCVL